jgi:hypothetical protein
MGCTSGKKIMLLCVLLIAASTAAAVNLAAADFSTGARLGLEPDQGGTYRGTAGVDLRVIGGRGWSASKLSVDYLGANYRGYAGNAAGRMFVLSSYALVQASLFYGDLTFYIGPGTSLYIIPGSPPVSGSTIGNDALIHSLFGGAYTLYPLQFFAEAEFDMPFTGGLFSEFNRPRVRVGVSVLQ